MPNINIEDNKDSFVDLVKSIQGNTGFTTQLIEKDYYLTKTLDAISIYYGRSIIFKGGTCLNKVYLDYYRLSEDLDFTMMLPDKPTRTARSQTIDKFRGNIVKLTKSVNLSCDDRKGKGFNNSTQYVFQFKYPSLFLPDGFGVIKVEIGLRYNPLISTVQKQIQHLFLDPFTNDPLFETQQIFCLDYQECVAEKIRALLTRIIPASRDLFDINYIIREGFNFESKEFISLLCDKLQEDKKSTNLETYTKHLGRSQQEISLLKNNLESELSPVLRPQDFDVFNFQEALDRIENIIKLMSSLQ